MLYVYKFSTTFHPYFPNNTIGKHRSISEKKSRKLKLFNLKLLKYLPTLVMQSLMLKEKLYDFSGLGQLVAGHLVA